MVRQRTDGSLERLERAKGLLDGADSVDEMAERLEAKAEDLRELDEEGWELEQPVKDDYAFLMKD